ncbi:class I SAM-dependent methyltransferase [Rhodococcus sp. (in: high G+C Gram-positive bacteria)]|uniref:class I SAM-dependent methyltransferase n=1 Tax=Rhodococcus sp. TaxID=1831 RepID=UPI003BB6AB39
MTSSASRLLDAFDALLGVELPVRVRCWDGSEAGPPGAVTRIVLNRRRALRRMVWAPNELGLTRAYISGDLDVDDLPALLGLPVLLDRIGNHTLDGLRARALARTAATLVRLAGVGLPPRPPAVEIRRRRGIRHSRDRDSVAVSHHYDVGNDFYRLFLGPSMVYSCGYWAEDDAELDTAQRDKCDLVCRKLGLEPGMRLLDVGCGWGSLAVHAAREYGVDVVGVTLSREQHALATTRIAEAGLSDRIDIRVQDYRDIDGGPYDAISSVGMSEHVGLGNLPLYAADMHALLRPGGRLLNHAIARVRSLPDKPGRAPSFIDHYIFPDGEVLPLSKTVDAFERAGLEVRDGESLREHYSLTLRAWVSNLLGSWDDAVRSVGAERARTWLLYLTASALGFDAPNRLTIYQVLAVRPTADGGSGLPRTRDRWLGAPRAAN